MLDKAGRKTSLIGVMMTAVLAACNGGPQFAGGVSDDRPSSDDSQMEPGQDGTATFKFHAGKVGDADSRMDPARETVSHRLTFHREKQREVTYRQAQRPKVHREKRQGHQGDTANESFNLRQAGPLDLLLVVDNSDSMTWPQVNLADSLEPLLGHVMNTNWQIGIVTTDSSCLREMITRDEYEADPDGANERFRNAIVEAGTSGGVERGVQMAMEGLKGNCGRPSESWVRSDATVGVLFVTNEINCGSTVPSSPYDNECEKQDPPLPYYGPEDFLSSTPENTTVYGLLHLDKLCGTEYDRRPEDYLKLIDRTGGIWDKICQEDYTQILNSVSADVSEVVKRRFDLSHAPDPGTVTVRAGEQVLDHEVQGRQVVLTGPIETNARDVKIDYRYGSRPRWQKIDLTEAPDPRTLRVQVDGESLPRSTFRYDGEREALVFHDVPRDDALVKVDYRIARGLRAEFPVPEEAYSASVRVVVEGEPTEGFSYDEETSQVRFNVPPLDGKIITIRYNLPGDYKRSYPVEDPEGSKVQGVRMTDVKTGADVEVWLDDGHMVVPLNEVQEGRVVEATLETDKMAVNLPYEPLAGSVSVTGGAPCVDDFLVTGRKVVFPCSKDLSAPVRITYRYVTGFQSKFKIPKALAGQTLRVFVDGAEIGSYTIEGNKVSIPTERLRPGSKVTVKLKTPGRD